MVPTKMQVGFYSAFPGCLAAAPVAAVPAAAAAFREPGVFVFIKKDIL